MNRLKNTESGVARVRIWRSWEFAVSEIAEDLAVLRSRGDLRKGGPFPVIWGTRQKIVLKVQCPSGCCAAYKVYCKVSKPWKWLFRFSPCGAETVNFQRITKLGIGMPRLLAAGDVRRYGLLRGAFLMTEFAEGFRDGRDFLSDGICAEESALRDEMIRRNLQFLALCHNAGILHRGFTPANLLYRKRDEKDAAGNLLDLLWIDVASCRKLPQWILKRMFRQDLVQFFRFFAFDKEMLTGYLRAYCDASRTSLDPDKLAEQIAKAL